MTEENLFNPLFSGLQILQPYNPFLSIDTTATTNTSYVSCGVEQLVKPEDKSKLEKLGWVEEFSEHVWTLYS